VNRCTAAGSRLRDLFGPDADRGKSFSAGRRDSTGTLEGLYDIWNSDVEPVK
jgi:hypothetical protein